MNSFDKANAQANRTLDTALQNQDEEGVSARIDDAYFTATRDTGGKSLPGYNHAPKWEVTVGVGKQASQFFTLVRTKGHPNQTLLFVFADSAAGWKLRYEVQVGRVSIPSFSSGGRAKLVSPDRSALAALTAYWNDYRSTKPGSHGFAPGPLTSRRVASLHSSVAQERAQGGVVGYSFAANPSQPVAVAAGAGQIVLGAVDESNSFHPVRAASCTVQNGARTVWNPLVKPGSYGSVTLRVIAEVAIYVPRSGPKRVLGEYPGVVAAHTSPCTKPKQSTPE